MKKILIYEKLLKLNKKFFLSLLICVIFCVVVLTFVIRVHASACLTNWTCQDIGSPNVAGSANIVNGVWTMQASGSDIYGTSDQGFLATTPIATDGAIIARVTAISGPSVNGKAGVVIRQDTASPSAYMGIFVTVGNGLQLQYRSASGNTTSSSTATDAAHLTLPIYLRIQRVGNAFTAASSPDGVTWTDYNWGRNLTTSGSMVAGLMETSHSSNTLGSATFDNVSFSNADDSCPSSWSCLDTGNPTLPGAQSLASGTWTAFGSGSDIYSTSDNGRFVYQSLPGDGTVETRVTSQYNSSQFAKAGIAIRQDTSTASAYMGMYVSPNNGLQLQYRSTAGGNTISTAAIAAGGYTLPIYLRIIKSGASYTPETSTNGTNWTTYNYTQTLTTSGTVLAGLQVTSHNNNAMGYATFDTTSVATTDTISGTVFTDTNGDGSEDNGETGYQNATVTLSGGASASTTTDSSGNYSFGGLSPGSSYTVTVTLPTGYNATTTNPVTISSLNGNTTENFGIQQAPCPTTWTCSDIGSPALTGSESLSSGTWSVQAGGSDIFGTSDQGHLDAQPLPSDGIVTARVVTQSNSDPHAKAGVAIRQDTSAVAANMAIFVTPSNGLTIQYRTSSGGSTSSTTATDAAHLTLPIYLRIVRNGTYFTPQSSTDGVTWIDYSYTKQLTVSGSMQAGLMMTSHNSGTFGNATFDHVSINVRNFCPFGWSCQDVGSVPISGNSFEDYANSNTFYIQGSGNISSGRTNDQFQYVSQGLFNDGSVQARLVNPSVSGLSTGQTGIMLRQDTSAGSYYYGILVQPSGALSVQYRNPVNNTSTTFYTTTVSFPEYIRLRRSVGAVLAEVSSDGVNWTTVNVISLDSYKQMQIGFVSASQDASNLLMAEYDNVSFTGTDGTLGPFLQTNNQNFTYNGKNVTLYGSTIYPSSGGTAPNYSWKDYLFTQRIDWDLNLAQQANLDIIRPTDQTNGSSDDPYNPVVWANMDYLVQQAQLRNMFVIIDLSTYGNHLKSQGTNPYTASLWTDYINFVTNRYKYATNVSNYSVQGEVNTIGCNCFPTSTTQGYLDFFTGTTNQVYSDDQNHLITAGGFSHLNDPNSGIPWQNIYALSHVNFAAIHVYPSDPTNPISSNKDYNITMPMVSTWAQQNNKPAEVEEYGFQQQLSDSTRASAMQTIQQAVASYGFSGQLLWNLGPQVLGGTNYDVNPSYPLAWAQLVNDAPAAFTFTGVTHTVPTSNPSSTSGPPSPNFHTGWSYVVEAGPSYIGIPTFISGGDGATDAKTFIAPNAASIDLYIVIKKVFASDIGKLIKLPWQQGFNTYGEMYDFVALSAFNGYPAPSFIKPVTIIIPYDPKKLGRINPQSLRIAYYNTTLKRWMLLPGKPIIDYWQHTLSTTVTSFSYFVPVYPKYVTNNSVKKTANTKNNNSKKQ